MLDIVWLNSIEALAEPPIRNNYRHEKKSTGETIKTNRTSLLLLVATFTDSGGENRYIKTTAPIKTIRNEKTPHIAKAIFKNLKMVCIGC
jgi:hypothetical protein